jgi:hypothetical protein
MEARKLYFWCSSYSEASASQKQENVVCTIHVYQVIVYQLAQQYIYVYSQATYIATCVGGGYHHH